MLSHARDSKPQSQGHTEYAHYLLLYGYHKLARHLGDCTSLF